VVIKQKGINAHSAIVTVRKIFPPADATKSTFFAVVWILVRGHPQITNVAVVRSKLNPTVYAVVSFARLSRVAFSTNHFFDGKSINVVMSLFVIEICGKRGTAMRSSGGGSHTPVGSCWHFDVFHSCVGSVKTCRGLVEMIQQKWRWQNG
jgi:hypothetical protein